MKINLLIEFFEPKNEERLKEYLDCLNNNLQLEKIDKIHIFNDHIKKIIDLSEKNEKVISVIKKNRMRYSDFLDYANLNLKNEICIISNSDIIFDDSLENVKKTKTNKFFFCLTRHDITKDGTLNFPSYHFGTQDAWIFIPPVKTDKTNFMLGMPGCDNRISFVMEKNGCIVSNPSKHIIIKHLHNSGYRTYQDFVDTVMGEYIYLYPTDDVNVLSEKKYAFNDNGAITLKQ